MKGFCYSNIENLLRNAFRQWKFGSSVHNIFLGSVINSSTECKPTNKPVLIDFKQQPCNNHGSWLGINEDKHIEW